MILSPYPQFNPLKIKYLIKNYPYPVSFKIYYNLNLKFREKHLFSAFTPVNIKISKNHISTINYFYLMSNIQMFNKSFFK